MCLSPESTHVKVLAKYHWFNRTLQDEDQIRYHIVLEEKLLKSDMHNGMHRETMLGFSYQVGFFLQNDQVLLSIVNLNFLLFRNLKII